jgi:hypothetical protein
MVLLTHFLESETQHMADVCRAGPYFPYFTQQSTDIWYKQSLQTQIQ